MFNENQYYEPDEQYTDVNELIDDDKNVSTCDLAGGKINNKIVDTFDEIDFNLHFGGCNGCTNIDSDNLEKEVYSVVQGNDSEKFDSISIKYGIGKEGVDNYGLDKEKTKSVGKEICEKLEKFDDIYVEWNEDPNKCIKVIVDE